jgi:hypothetical protein
MIELFFRFTVKGTVLRNNVFFFNMLWRSIARSSGLKSATSEKPVLHRDPPCLKNRCFKTGDLKNLLANLSLDQNYR